MNKYELETLKIKFEACARYPWASDEVVGSACIGISTMYRQPAHEFHNIWLRLTPSDKPNAVSGYLKVSAFIVGPQDSPPVHQADEIE